MSTGGNWSQIRAGGGSSGPCYGAAREGEDFSAYPGGDQGVHMQTQAIADGASIAQEIFFLKMFFQLIAKEEMVTDAGRRQTLPTPGKSH